MKFTDEEIGVRAKVWGASKFGRKIELSAEECSALWESMLKTGLELADYREGIREFIATTAAHGKSGRLSFSSESSDVGAKLAKLLTES